VASIRKNLAYNFVLSASQVLLPLISIPYISRVLDPEGIGKVSFIDSFSWYFVSIAEFGIAVYGMREVARLRNDGAARSRLVSELLTLHIISSCITLVLYLVSVYLLWHKVQDERLLWFSLSFLLVNFFQCEWYFRGMERFKYITLRSLATRLLGLLAIFVLVTGKQDYSRYYGIIVVPGMLNMIWNVYVLFKEESIRLKGSNWKQHIRKTSLIYFLNLTYDITLFLDTVLLGIISSAVAVAYYAYSIKIARTFGTLLTDSLLVFFPRIVHLHKENESQALQQVVMNNFRLLAFFAVPVAAGLFLLADPLIRVFLGTQFVEAIEDLRLLAFFPLLRSYNLFLGNQVLIAQNNERLYLLNLLLSSMVFVVLAVFLCRHYADTGNCLALLLSEMVLLAANFRACRSTAGHLPLFDAKAFWQAGISTIVFVPVVWYIAVATNPFVALIAGALTGAVLYGAMQFFVMRNILFAALRTRWGRSGKNS
jgi:Membrane protein involved in the export of O-antigen and teichoic acid